ncbi:unnamed protein product [Kluyveromyces dobzhanskii CBS 2104]|uniref:WGS project CCBQ000000000 data, contig 00012 n=1 Tax=Kluyveromyces dobzhanskii CBS 2104 TaxID=1427455 RepID=A0A0A8L0W1_9SACH|nr:unnamed protein product [Kluyveromyces dobzhanskii CBS 2104]
MNCLRNNETIENQQPAKTVIVMVGLPARGKSTIAKQIESTISEKCRIFNAGQRRRQTGSNGSLVPNEQIFDMSDANSVKLRDDIALSSLKELLSWLQSGPNNSVGIFDATNSTVKRRTLILDTLERHSCVPMNVIFIEVVVDSDKILEEHLYWKVRQSNDYKHLENKEWCISDFQSRMKQYEAVYEPIQQNEFKTCYNKKFPISTFQIKNRYQRCLFHGEEPPAFIYFALLSLQRQWFVEKNAHLTTLRYTKAKRPSGFFVPWTWLKLRKLF